MTQIMERTWSTRNNEFLKYVSPGAGLGRIKHCVLDADHFPTVTVDEGSVTTKKIARKGQVIVRKASDQLWIPYKRTEVAVAGATGDSALVVDDATVFAVGETVAVEDAANSPFVITAIDYETNTLTLDDTLGATVAVDNSVGVANLIGANIDDWAVCGDEMDLTNGDKAAPGYYLHCVFYADAVFGYAGNEAEVEAGLSTCEFEARVDPTA